MELSTDIKKYIQQSVLCWLATISEEGYPSVSPKEVFDCFNDRAIIIANIASPGSIRNIKFNSKVCLSFIDILVQKGYQIKGEASIVDKSSAEFEKMYKLLSLKTQGKFSFNEIIIIKPRTAKAIIAPSYMFFSDITEEEQRISAKKAYGF